MGYCVKEAKITFDFLQLFEVEKVEAKEEKK